MPTKLYDIDNPRFWGYTPLDPAWYNRKRELYHRATNTGVVFFKLSFNGVDLIIDHQNRAHSSINECVTILAKENNWDTNDCILRTAWQGTPLCIIEY